MRAAFLNRLFNTLPCVATRHGLRQLPSSGKKTLYLSFDDGPGDLTKDVLGILDEAKAKASFFVIGKKAKARETLLKEIQRSGHAIGDHSWDHDYRHFFKSQAHLENWVAQSQAELTTLLGEKPIGFRSPAGIEPPTLRRALSRLGIPQITWAHRYFDTRFPLTPAQIKASQSSWTDGDILLLHDESPAGPPADFLTALKWLLATGTDLGFSFEPLSPAC